MIPDILTPNHFPYSDIFHFPDVDQGIRNLPPPQIVALYAYVYFRDFMSDRLIPVIAQTKKLKLTNDRDFVYLVIDQLKTSS